MSILDENKNEFVYDCRHMYYITKFDRLLGPSKVLTIKCRIGGCLACIGHKYNLQNGCPVCGGQTVEVNGHTHTCLSCGAVMMTCGRGDVSAIGIPLVKSTEDTV